MHIIIKEENGFMPDTIIRIFEDRVELEENKRIKILNYDKNQIKEIMVSFLEIFDNWKSRYEDKGIIDEDSFVITIVSSKTKEIYIKNKYPQNWSKFILLRNRLIREEIKFN